MDDETRKKLHQLRGYLDQLPHNVPLKNSATTDYHFDTFGIDSEDLEDLGVEGYPPMMSAVYRSAPIYKNLNPISGEATASVPGRSPGGPPQPRPFDPEVESSDSENGSDSDDDIRVGSADHLQERTPIDDGVRWLDKTRKSRGTSEHTTRNTFTIGGRSDIDLTSPFFQDVLDDNPKSGIPVAAANTKTKDSSVGEATKAVPNVSDWENW